MRAPTWPRRDPLRLSRGLRLRARARRMARGTSRRQPMTLDPTVAIMSPGDMGHATAAMLRSHGLRVISCLEGRSARSRALAAKAGIETVPDDDAMVREADLLLSILVPAQAESLARRIAAALARDRFVAALRRLQRDRAGDGTADRRRDRGGGRPVRRRRHHRPAPRTRQAHGLLRLGRGGGGVRGAARLRARRAAGGSAARAKPRPSRCATRR